MLPLEGDKQPQQQPLLSVQGSQLPLSKAEEVKCRMSQGRAPLFTDMRIVNDEGQALPWDGKAAGQLQVRGPHVIRAYFKVTFHPKPFSRFQMTYIPASRL